LTELILSHALYFQDLYEREGLEHIDVLFINVLKTLDESLSDRLMVARKAPDMLEYKDEAALIVALAPYLEDFVGELFCVQKEISGLAEKRNKLAPLYACKRQFVQKQAKARDIPAKNAGKLLAAALEEGFGEPFSELSYARHVMDWLEDKDAHAELLDTAACYAVWALHTRAGQAMHAEGLLFGLPARIDSMRLIHVDTADIEGVPMMQAPKDKLHQRDGFKFVDSSSGLKGALDQANYCIWCHKQGRDSCSKGLREKLTGAFRANAFGDEMTGCPLEEKISEMNWLMSEGHALGALAVACINNPMLAGTGHRICNDCMKACVYQKQEPVDIPQIESQALKEVLALSWGFEIYSLLTRWNPLNIRRPLPKPETGFKVLVVGMGPAGYTLSHHLMNDGHHVVAVDGLKIEPLPCDVSGVAPDGARMPFTPVRDIDMLFEPLESRLMAGFGGVAEYGITARWNKNYLKVIRLLLERRAQFSMYGGVRFGGTLTVDDAFDMGFDHVALCMGAGKPTILDVPNGLARGVRQASDFLMSLQLTGTAKTDSIVNLQLRLPVVVIGGGLTAIDTATESLAYYPLQVEKFLCRYETLAAASGKSAVRAGWTEEEAAIADEFMAHAKAIRHEREQAAAAGREADIIRLLNSWGGVTIAYRRRMVDSPSYTLNHEEISMGLAEGVRFAELLSPTAIDVDGYGHAVSIRFARCEINNEGRPAATGGEVTLPARAILIAAGTRPNITLAAEDPAGLQLDDCYFQAVDEAGHPVKPAWSAKPEQVYVLTHVRDDGRAISFYGDMHPSFAGNVVRAMASARHGSSIISRMFTGQRPVGVDAGSLQRRLNNDLRASVHRVERLTPNMVEVVVHAPAAARSFRPGQFFRLQNYEINARHVNGTTLAMEGLAVAGAKIEPDTGLVSLIVRERGGSSSLCQLLAKGEPVVLMGPTGAAAEVTADESVLLIGGGVGNIMLLSIAQAYRQAGSKVLRFAAYEKVKDCCKAGDIEASADRVVWCCNESPGLEPGRKQDMTFTGNVITALTAYGQGKLGGGSILLQEIDRIVVAGSAHLMAAVLKARHENLAAYLKPGHVAIGSINSPMQCMMKKICAQCLQLQRDPDTGEQRVVYSCSSQYQRLDCVDFAILMQRQGQQSVQEKLTAQWVHCCLESLQS